METAKTYTPAPVWIKDCKLNSEYTGMLPSLVKEAHERRNLKRCHDGWKYGEKFDETQKLTPEMVPFEELPQQLRDQLTGEMQENLQYLQHRGYRLATESEIITSAENEVKAMKPRSLYAHISKAFWLMLAAEIIISIAIFWYINDTYLFSPKSCLALLCFILFSCFAGYFTVMLMRNAVNEYNSEYELYLRYKQAWLDKKAGFLPQKS